ncbi:RNA polymerase sigma factor [Natranaerobius thermophilus]|uniref:RNA polymerase, sigma-24 subunit, ECF subfamily n=1 Tax=Natranaerobius thermophilus (strain ATCC BAA-1301 / DSM 18059 / JW/NM-WN-LF) TaxID=457570 RepID=B2A738_NATTJ|nr:sigma-70 family RNA polymerase sigma factor [Natranaerobius thermophilus]ACB85629.1 RNA polymerase, sigma-24 subunit, ECF subfamily [Natranaerobius thermophilus JW/NM-WN-LF]
MAFTIQESEFEKIFAYLRPKIYRFFYYKMHNHDEAEELTQETFRKVWGRLDHLKLTPDQITSYIYTTARNTLYDFWRKRKISTVGLDEIANVVAKDNPEQLALIEEENEMIKRALGVLPEEQRLVIELRFVEGLTTKETAIQLLKSPGSVRSLQHRAIKNLKNIITRNQAENPLHN